jgi:hypothetical protein
MKRIVDDDVAFWSVDTRPLKRDLRGVSLFELIIKDIKA